jgi:hypothetical protein
VPDVNFLIPIPSEHIIQEKLTGNLKKSACGAAKGGSKEIYIVENPLEDDPGES